MRDLLVVGGIPVKDQIAALNNGIDIVCGTPGRMEELINTGQLSLQSCKFFVLDEADGLLKQVMMMCESLANKIQCNDNLILFRCLVLCEDSVALCWLFCSCS